VVDLSTSGANAKNMDIPLNAWYAAAYDHEVSGAQILARTVANRPMAFYRTADGRPVALTDACWHRLAPLSRGKLVGADGIQCPYHGLVFNSAGRCVHMPAQETINPSAMVSSFPVVDRYRFTWVWPGDPMLADPAIIPDMHQMDHPDWAGEGGSIEMEANFQLVLDNLMDLTHEEFVHVSSLGQDGLSEAEIDVVADDRTVTLTRWLLDTEPAPFWRRNLGDRFPGFTGRVDRWQIIRFEVPSTICIDVGVAKAGTGAPEGDRSQGVNGFVMHTILPVDKRTSLYHWSFVRNWSLQSQSLTTQIQRGVSKVIGEDEAVLADQQRAIEANPDHEFYNLNIDAGGMWVRRLIQRMVEGERLVAGEFRVAEKVL
jgi:phenylpropionate dioxygenase-like ring-hydroxylating dioxygenase large terminal subunit